MYKRFETLQKFSNFPKNIAKNSCPAVDNTGVKSVRNQQALCLLDCRRVYRQGLLEIGNNILWVSLWHKG
jgi:hypothetical protein